MRLTDNNCSVQENVAITLSLPQLVCCKFVSHLWLKDFFVFNRDKEDVNTIIIVQTMVECLQDFS